MNKFFINHLFDIFMVGSKKRVDVDVAFDMFRVDVANGRSQNCGDTLPDFDFAKAKKEWDKLGEDEQRNAIYDYSTFVRNHYEDACAAFLEGKKACEALIKEAE